MITVKNVQYNKLPNSKGGKQQWQLSFWEVQPNGARSRIRRQFPTRALAEAHYNGIVEAVKRGIYKQEAEAPAATLAELVERYQRDVSSFKRPRTQYRDTEALERFLAHVGAQTQVDKITLQHLDSYKAWRAKSGRKNRKTGKRSAAKPGTINRDLAVIKHLFSTAKRWKVIRELPTEGLDMARMPEKPVVYLELDEQERLLSAATVISSQPKFKAPHLRPLIGLALNTGLRRGELFHLRWQDIDAVKRQLVVRNSESHLTKSGRERVVGLNAAALRELSAWREWFRREIAEVSALAACTRVKPQTRQRAEARLEVLRRCEPRPERLVFPSLTSADANGEPLPLDNVDRTLERARMEAGIERHFGLHVLRHTFAVTAARQGVNLYKLALVLGHADIQTTQRHYLRFLPTEGADVTDALPEIGARSLGGPVGRIVPLAIAATA